MRRVSLPITICLLGLVTTTAHAGFVMVVDDPSTQGISVRIEDDGAEDSNQIPGLIGFSGVVGGVQLSATGESKGAVGSVSAPQLNLHVDPSTRLGDGFTGGTVDILITDTGFNADSAKGIASIDVNGFGGSFEISLFGDSSDREFVEVFEIASTGGPVSPGYDETLEGDMQPVGSLTIRSRVGFTSTTHAAGFQTELTLAGAPGKIWQNPDNPIDIDASSSVEPLDVLLVINSINDEGARQLPDSPGPGEGPPPFYDSSGDGYISPLDALLVINFLNDQPAAAAAASGVGVATVPEPSGATLLLLGSLIFALRRSVP